MEFVELTLLFIVALLLLFKPQYEKTAYWITMLTWAVVVFMYLGHTAHAVFSYLNV